MNTFITTNNTVMNAFIQPVQEPDQSFPGRYPHKWDRVIGLQDRSAPGSPILTTLWRTYHGDTVGFISCKWENLRLNEVK